MSRVARRVLKVLSLVVRLQVRREDVTDDHPKAPHFIDGQSVRLEAAGLVTLCFGHVKLVLFLILLLVPSLLPSNHHHARF